MKATITDTVTQVFKKEICCNCRIPFFIEDHFMEERRQDKRLFYCPNGHGQHYVEGEADRLRKENQQLKSNLERQANSAAFFKDEVDRISRRLSAAKGQNTKFRKRVQGGVCPCCNRSFMNLRRHMETKHPDPKAEQEGT